MDKAHSFSYSSYTNLSWINSIMYAALFIMSLKFLSAVCIPPILTVYYLIYGVNLGGGSYCLLPAEMRAVPQKSVQFPRFILVPAETAEICAWVKSYPLKKSVVNPRFARFIL